MAEKILIMGESGTGKSTSIRNCDPAITAIVNPVGKPLPFRGSKKFVTLNGITDCGDITDFMKAQAKAGKKIIIVDDFQYILAIPYMNRIKETGWDKYNDFGSNYFNIIDVCNELPDDVCVYYLTHCETLENGLTTVKLIGKLLREKITVEGLFTIVLRTGVSEGKYYFFTQNNGKDTVKSPMGMFDTFSIENDLNYVDAKIRNYYELDGAVSDETMAEMDSLKAGDFSKPEPRRHRNSSRNNDNNWVNIPNELDKLEQEPTSNRRRKTHDEVVADNEAKVGEYIQKQADAIESVAGDKELIPIEEVPEVEVPTLDPVPRRRRSEINESTTAVTDESTDVQQQAEEQPIRRTRRQRG